MTDSGPSPESGEVGRDPRPAWRRGGRRSARSTTVASEPGARTHSGHRVVPGLPGWCSRSSSGCRRAPAVLKPAARRLQLGAGRDAWRCARGDAARSPSDPAVPGGAGRGDGPAGGGRSRRRAGRDRERAGLPGAGRVAGGAATGVDPGLLRRSHPAGDRRCHRGSAGDRTQPHGQRHASAAGPARRSRRRAGGRAVTGRLDPGHGGWDALAVGWAMYAALDPEAGPLPRRPPARLCAVHGDRAGVPVHGRRTLPTRCRTSRGRRRSSPPR